MFTRKRTSATLLAVTGLAILITYTGKAIMEVGTFMLTGLAGIGMGIIAGMLAFPRKAKRSWLR